MFSGSAEAMLEEAAARKALGTNPLIVVRRRSAIEQTLDRLQLFAEDAVRKFV